MTKKLIPFRGKKDHISDSPDGKIVETGKIRTLSYQVIAPNEHFAVVRVFDDKGLQFKKDASAFEDTMSKLEFDKMSDGEFVTIKGSGINDDLIFTLKDGEMLISLKKRGYAVVEKLKDVIARKGKKSKE